MNRSINWPACISYAGDDELTYIANQAEWDHDPDLSRSEYDAQDVLIDSHGNTFSLDRENNPVVTPNAKIETLDCSQLTRLVRAHFACTGACCSARLNSASIAQCMDLLARERESQP